MPPLAYEFRSFSAPVAILASSLLSTFGGLVALLATRTTFNVASFMGMIMVIGIVAKNGILLLDAEHRFRQSGATLEDAMIQAGRRRLRPIAMTALATIAGMLPLALAIGAGSQMLQPLAINGSRRPTQLDGSVPGFHSGNSLLSAKDFLRKQSVVARRLFRRHIANRSHPSQDHPNL
jgi:AcrB/AcrD/AcrF family